MEKKYDCLPTLKKDIETNNFNLKTIHLIAIHNMLYKLPVHDRLIGFQDVHTYFLNQFQSEIGSIDQLVNEKRPGIEEDMLLRFRVLQEEHLNTMKRRLATITELIHFFNNDGTLPYEVNSVYSITDWDCAYFTTGEQSDIASSKAKILETSIFLNAYDTFISVPHDESDIPYIAVQPSYGMYRKCSIYLRTDKIICK